MTARLSPPLSAHTRTVHRPIGPASYDCVQLVVVRDGTAIVFSEFGEQPVSFGDAILLGPNVLCGTEPEGQLTVTTIYIDTDLTLDQFFWQYSTILHDRLDAQGFAKKVYSEPAQVLQVLLQSWGESSEDSVSHSLMAAACGRSQAVSKTRLTITASGFGCP